jgi:hypothetical protein
MKVRVTISFRITSTKYQDKKCSIFSCLVHCTRDLFMMLFIIQNIKTQIVYHVHQ